jgi:hypothetical protein
LRKPLQTRLRQPRFRVDLVLLEILENRIAWRVEGLNLGKFDATLMHRTSYHAGRIVAPELKVSKIGPQRLPLGMFSAFRSSPVGMRRQPSDCNDHTSLRRRGRFIRAQKTERGDWYGRSGVAQKQGKAVMSKQFRLFQNGATARAFACWAYLDEAAEQRLLAGQPRLRPADWHAGDRAWLIGLVAPFGGIDGVLANLKQTTFKDSRLMAMRPGPDGKGMIAFEVQVEASRAAA